MTEVGKAVFYCWSTAVWRGEEEPGLAQAPCECPRRGLGGIKERQKQESTTGQETGDQRTFRASIVWAVRSPANRENVYESPPRLVAADKQPITQFSSCAYIPGQGRRTFKRPP